MTERNYALIDVGKRHLAAVDKDDVERVGAHRWYLSVGGHGKKFYAETMIDGRKVKMHRLIMNARPGETVEHLKGDGMDNRRQNLRVIRAMQQSTRWGKRHAVGVVPRYLKGHQRNSPVYEAWIQNDGRNRYLGRFKTKEEAALAYDREAIRRYGPAARTNIVGLEKIRSAVKASDSNVNESDDSFKTAVILMASAYLGPCIRLMMRLTGYPRIFIVRRYNRFLENGIWDVKNRKVHGDWFGKDGGTAFWMDVMVGEGLMERTHGKIKET